MERRLADSLPRRASKCPQYRCLDRVPNRGRREKRQVDPPLLPAANSQLGWHARWPAQPATHASPTRRHRKELPRRLQRLAHAAVVTSDGSHPMVKVNSAATGIPRLSSARATTVPFTSTAWAGGLGRRRLRIPPPAPVF